MSNSSLNVTFSPFNDTTSLNTNMTNITTTPTVNFVEPASSYFPVVVGLLAIAGFTSGILLHYGHFKTCPWYVKVASWISWTMPFMVILLLPWDMTSSLYRQCSKRGGTNCDQPFALIEETTMHQIWQAVYWTAQILTWIIIPLMRSYMWSGGFTVLSRMRGSLHYNLWYHGALAGAGVAIYLVFAVVSHVWDPRKALIPFAMSCANAYGLMLIVIFLGSGLIDLPRELWHAAYNKRTLKFLQYRAASVREAYIDADAELDFVAKAVAYVSSRVPEISELRPLVNKLVRICPVSAQGGRRLQSDEELPEKIDQAYLMDLHERLKRTIVAKDRMYATWRVLLRDAWRFEDIISNRDNPDRRFHSTLRKPTGRRFHDQRLTLEWYWYLRIRPYLFRTLSVLSGIFSVIIIWSEVTLFVADNDQRPKLSIFRWILGGQDVRYSTIETISIISIIYMSACAYSSLMKMKVFSKYSLLPDHHTDPISLLFFGAFFCRIAYPLCHNFLNLSGNTNNTVFENIMGRINISRIFGDQFALYVPILMSITCLITLFNVTGRILKLFGMESLFDERRKQDDMKANEGRNIIQQARRQEERRIARGEVGKDKDFDAFNVFNVRKEQTPKVTSNDNSDRSKDNQAGRFGGLFKSAKVGKWQQLQGEEDIEMDEPDQVDSLVATGKTGRGGVSATTHSREPSMNLKPNNEGQHPKEPSYTSHTRDTSLTTHTRDPSSSDASSETKGSRQIRETMTKAVEKGKLAVDDAKKYAVAGKAKVQEVAKTVNEKISTQPAPIISQSFGRPGVNSTSPSEDKAAALLQAASMTTKRGYFR